MLADAEATPPPSRKPMKAESVRLCPACGTRNKPKWEYCVNCGESLQDVALGIPATVSQVALLPVGYHTGDDFKVAPRRPAEELTYWDTWKVVR